MCLHEPDNFPMLLNTFPVKSIVILTNVIFFILSNKMFQQLECLCNSANQYFSKDLCMMLQNYTGVKDPFKEHGSLKYFNVRGF